MTSVVIKEELNHREHEAHGEFFDRIHKIDKMGLILFILSILSDFLCVLRVLRGFFPIMWLRDVVQQVALCSPFQQLPADHCTIRL